MRNELVLLPQHQVLVNASAISADVAVERGYRSVESRAELRRLGFSESQCRVPTLVIPIYDAFGEIRNYQSRPDEPRVGKDGRTIKYETPSGSRLMLDVPPRCRTERWIADPSRALIVTEGVRKADSAVSRGVCCIALLGVWGWRGRNEFGGLTALADWESIAIKGRDIFICFDSDVMTKREVHGAMTRLKTFLDGRGARVRPIYLPAELAP